LHSWIYEVLRVGDSSENEDSEWERVGPLQDEDAGASVCAAAGGLAWVAGFFGRPRPPVALLAGALRGEDVAAEVFCLLAAGAFLGEAVDALFLPDAEAGRLLVPEVTLLGPVAGADPDARLDVFEVLFLAAPLALGLALDLVLFLVAGFFPVVARRGDAFFLGEPETTFDCFSRVFNSFLPASAILKEAFTRVKTLFSTPL